MLLKDEGPIELPPPPPGNKEKFTLTSLTLLIIGFTISSLLLILVFLPFEGTQNFDVVLDAMKNDSIPSPRTDTLIQRKIELVRYIQEEKKDYREFFLKICQMILLNLLSTYCYGYTWL